MAVDNSVKDLLALVKSTLSAEEIAWMSTPDTRNNEPDAFTALQNHFTQKNTDAIVKCMSFLTTAALMALFVSIEHSDVARNFEWGRDAQDVEGEE